jgi:apolipoprotein N-acyltransferase
MKIFFHKNNFRHRSIQFIIFFAHILLLKWILYALYEGGILPFKTLMYHFIGMSLYGALLIRFCAYFYKRQYQKELKESGEQSKLEG